MQKLDKARLVLGLHTLDEVNAAMVGKLAQQFGCELVVSPTLAALSAARVDAVVIDHEALKPFGDDPTALTDPTAAVVQAAVSYRLSAAQTRAYRGAGVTTHTSLGKAVRAAVARAARISAVVNN